MNIATEYPRRRPRLLQNVTFRLPTSLLETLDRWCAKNDLTRSQFVRKAIKERMDPTIIEEETESEQNAGQGQQWRPNITRMFDRR